MKFEYYHGTVFTSTFLYLQHAYEVAKNILLEETRKCVCTHLIELQPDGEIFNDKLLKACMRIVDHVANDQVANAAIDNIIKVHMYVLCNNNVLVYICTK